MPASIQSLVRRVGELQPHWSSKNTDEMKERGLIIRKGLPEALNQYRDRFRNCLGIYGVDFDINASDGIGRKTEAPWVRLCSHKMSPDARSGYYLVYHFSADGQRFYVTLGFGSTTWNKDRGDLINLPPADLEKRRNWALSVLRDRGEDYSLFPDKINLGARASLPKQFEKATLLARVFDTKQSDDEEVILTTCRALELLVHIYDAQSLGHHLTSKEMIEADLIDITRPKASAKARQGYNLTGPERKAVEMRAMTLAHDYLKKESFKFKDTSKNNPYDFLAIGNGKETKVEVKGTTVKDAGTVLMTRNEVKLHRAEKGNTALIIVSGIQLTDRDSDPKAKGGDLKAFFPWDIDPCTVDPIAYEITLPGEKTKS